MLMMGSLTSFIEENLITHSPAAPRSNFILAALPDADRQRLDAYLRPTLFHQGDTLPTLDFAYFLKAGLLSVVATSQGGTEVEVGMIGSEGAAGFAEILVEAEPATRVQVQGKPDAL